MCISEDLFTGDGDSWLETLSHHQRSTINLYKAKGKTAEEIAELWLSARPENTFGFGGQSGQNLFLKSVRLQIHSFLCGGKDYAEDRKKLLEQGDVSKAMLVAALTSAIAPTVGASAVFLAPVVVLTLYTTCKIGLKSWCALPVENDPSNPA